MSDAAGLGDDAGELIDLRLGTAEGTEPLLGELTGTLYVSVSQLCPHEYCRHAATEPAGSRDGDRLESETLAQVTTL